MNFSFNSGTDVHGHQRMNPTDFSPSATIRLILLVMDEISLITPYSGYFVNFGGPLTFHLVHHLSSDQCFSLPNTLVYDHN